MVVIRQGMILQSPQKCIGWGFQTSRIERCDDLSEWIANTCANNSFCNTWAKMLDGDFSYCDNTRTASLLRIEMSILRVDKMRPLFQEVIVTELAVTQSTTRYQMKATCTIND